MSFYTSLSGLKNAQTSLDVISNNIANADTDGFKKSTASFSDIIASSVTTDSKETVGIGSRTEAVTQQFGLGSMQQTGNALDLAINGDGFFMTRSPIGHSTSYTRNGAFTVNGAGYLTDDAGDRVQVLPVDATGAATSTTATDGQVPLINASGANFTGMSVSGSGVLTAAYADGTTTAIGAVAIASFASNTGLKQIGSASWTATGLSGGAITGQAGSGDNGALLSGTLEGSNVDLSTELVGLIGAQRYFQANAKAIDTESTISETIINLHS